MVAQIWSRFGRAEVDLFASRTNTHCPLFFSMTAAHPSGWMCSHMYGSPLCCMILPVLERVCQQGLCMILLPPCWLAFSNFLSAGTSFPRWGGGVLHPRPELVAACLPFKRSILLATGLPPNVVVTIESAKASSTRGLYAYKW